MYVLSHHKINRCSAQQEHLPSPMSARVVQKEGQKQPAQFPPVPRHWRQYRRTDRFSVAAAAMLVLCPAC